MKIKNFCGKCVYIMEEDVYGRGWCAIRDMYTFVKCEEIACEEFITKNFEYNEQ